MVKRENAKRKRENLKRNNGKAGDKLPLFLR